MSYTEEIGPLRDEINRLNEEILEKISERVGVALRIGEVKKRHGVPIVDRAREEVVLDHVGGLAAGRGLDPEGVRRVFREIIDLCVRAEEEHG
ncbi:MAG TPA: chorismate mutase [Candidatus Krumholzibacteriaceae bacterium]|nr:chorismate mutase [Candidatus Krumholzibacteriaceae bacterium]